MYNMSKEQRELLETRRKQRRIRRIAVICACALCAVGAVTLVYLRLQPPTVRAAFDEAGNLTIPADKIATELTYVRVRGGKNLIAYRDSSGAVRTGFDTCEECYASGNSYTQSGSNMTCTYCGMNVALSTLGTAAWGGCQPVAVPETMRADTEDLIVIPAALIDYADTVFAAWDAGDYSLNLGYYAPADAEAGTQAQ